MGATDEQRAVTPRRIVTPLLAVTAGVFAAAAIALWWLVAWVFSSDRGIGFRDEGLYLLAADPPSPTARWVTPFGWHIAPFFRLLGHDVADLRTFAVSVLVLTGALLGWTIGRWLTDDGTGRPERVTRWSLAAVGAFGGPLLASGLLRTPGYNWVNLVGLLLATTGTVLAAMLPGDRSLWRSPAPMLQQLWWPAGCGSPFRRNRRVRPCSS